MKKTHYVMMDKDTKHKYLEGVEDILSDLVEKERTWHERFSCPRCSCDTLVARVDAHRPFGKGILPRKHLHCPNCQTVISPETGITIKEGGVGEDIQKMGRMFIQQEK